MIYYFVEKNPFFHFRRVSKEFQLISLYKEAIDTRFVVPGDMLAASILIFSRSSFHIADSCPRFHYHIPKWVL